MNPPTRQDPIAKLRESIQSLLGHTLGALPYRSGQSRPPTVVGLGWGIAYAILFCGLPFIVFGYARPLFWLSLWGSCYFACAATLAGFTSSAIAKVIDDKILSGLSERAVIAIDNPYLLASNTPLQRDHERSGHKLNKFSSSDKRRLATAAIRPPCQWRVGAYVPARC
jgi:hypothetical protein